MFAIVGHQVVGLVAGFGRLGHFLADTARAVPDARTWGPRTLQQMRRLGVDSLPIALFIAAFTGIVLALLASYVFTGAVPLYLVGTLVGKTMMLELGPVLTGLALAGRVGANIAAELGTMRVTEQVDALETLAYDPHAYLVMPRVLAGTVMFPIVVAFAMAMGVFTGWVAATTLLPVTTVEFLRGLRLFFVPFDIQYGLIKAASFGFVITLIGCYLGLATRGGAEGVGRATTRTVVYSAEMILVLDAFWAVTLLARPRRDRVPRTSTRPSAPSRVLEGFTLRCRDGETMVIIGYSGTGKSVAHQARGGAARAGRGTRGGGRPGGVVAAPARADRVAHHHRFRVPVRGAVRLADDLRQRGPRARGGGAT